jgi:hypothetical protein
MLRPFKITKRHLREYSELSDYDLGLYAIRVKDDQPLLVYESKLIATKAYKYFEKMTKQD